MREGPHVMEGELHCGQCRGSYPVRGGVPRLIGGWLTPDMAHTARNFGRQWKLFKEVEDERYRWQFLRWVQPLQPDNFQGQRVLDCGCGKGRHLRVVAGFGARDAVGVDLSEAVEVAFANTRHLENVHVVQADILHLPLKPDFDLAYSIGVLHHTPDPAASFKAMASRVRPGGTAACWVYGRENNGWIIHLLNPLRLGLTRYLPPLCVRLLAWLLGTVLWMAIWLVYVPLSKIGIRPYYGDYMLYLRDLGFAETRVIVYDHLTAPTAFYLPRAEVERWFSEQGFANPTLSWVQKVSWACVGKKVPSSELRVPS